MSHSPFDLSGRVVVVTGAAGGLGGAMAVGLAESGADLLVSDIHPGRLEAKAEEIRRLGRRAVPVVCDVSDFEQVRSLFATLDREFGRIDALFNVPGHARVARPEDLLPEDVQKGLQVLVVGRFLCCQEGGKRMLAAGKGSIVNIGSLASITAMGRGHIAYSMAMGAVVQMTRELSTEWASRGVRVNAILPAQIPSPWNGLEERMAADQNLQSVFLRGIPLGRLGRPDDIKGLAVFLASDASSFITGALIPLDGGNLAKNAGGSHPGSPV